MGVDRVGDILGTIRRRLLVNSWVDPDEVLPLLPAGVRPHVGSNGGVVVGCCMIEIEAARPWPLVRRAGVAIRAAAHRISVEVGPVESPTTAVWVPVRQTDSRPAVFAGGRIFPGVHVATQIVVSDDDHTLSWSVGEGPGSEERFDIAAVVSLDGAVARESEVADIVIGTTLGLSPGRRQGRVEAVEMCPVRTEARLVELTKLNSIFLNSFASGVEAESLLMTNVDVAWRRATFTV